MEIFEKLLSTIVMLIVYIAAGGLFLLFGWNFGVVPTLGSVVGISQISFKTSFWLAMFFSTLGGFFKSTATFKHY